MSKCLCLQIYTYHIESKSFLKCETRCKLRQGLDYKALQGNNEYLHSAYFHKHVFITTNTVLLSFDFLFCAKISQYQIAVTNLLFGIRKSAVKKWLLKLNAKTIN